MAVAVVFVIVDEAQTLPVAYSNSYSHPDCTNALAVVAFVAHSGAVQCIEPAQVAQAAHAVDAPQ